ncbi:hypothetical protein KIN20_031115 [Parelaphostrongylus tenuis]|uniref:Uncharacterized protein n=1 Tax=Parelaphostrongylus tenuis TaxID=148309 RepID=A0AAD5R546_PARTN|nr:hypothetical protein KIN20_031115 [Parelaphostrongylus tenuis]
MGLDRFEDLCKKECRIRKAYVYQKKQLNCCQLHLQRMLQQSDYDLKLREDIGKQVDIE